MNLLVIGVAAGISGTLVMDLLNNLFSRIGVISKIDMKMIGRMSAGWMHGRFLYNHPNEIRQVSNEKLYGYITHYAIGIAMALIFMIGWDIIVGGYPYPVWILLYGIATTVASVFFVYPCMGYGILGLRSPEGIKALSQVWQIICSLELEWRLLSHWFKHR